MGYYMNMGPTNSTPIRYANHKMMTLTNAEFRGPGLKATKRIYHGQEIFVYYDEDINSYYAYRARTNPPAPGTRGYNARYATRVYV
jgi:hypothetical protein